jgi:hypothetical protein
MNIIQPGDLVILSVPIGHAERHISLEFDRRFKELWEIPELKGLPLKIISAGVGAPDSSPEVMFVYRPAKSCVCED